jgi:hypothetical protein
MQMESTELGAILDRVERLAKTSGEMDSLTQTLMGNLDALKREPPIIPPPAKVADPFPARLKKALESTVDFDSIAVALWGKLPEDNITFGELREFVKRMDANACCNDTAMTKNPNAVALGALTKGGTKRITKAEAKRRASRAEYARQFRWTKKNDVELLAKVDEDAGVR